jgi:deazaflavin-dependent oxidoreductase (nitroreductase family)
MICREESEPMADMTEFLKQVAAGIEEHLQIYIQSDGSDEAYYRDMSDQGGDPKTKTLVLKTIGRKSGKEQLAPLIYNTWGDELVIVASKGGADNQPAWFHNTTATDEVDVQVRDKRYRCKWRIAEGEERHTLWRFMSGYYPPYLEYQARTERQIPVVVLTPVGDVEEKFVWRPGEGVDQRTGSIAANPPVAS